MLGGAVVYWLRDVLTPLLLAFLIAYLCDPVVDRLEAGHVPRPAAITLVLGGALSLVGLFLVLVLPGIATDVAGVIRELPTQLTALWATMVPWREQRGITVPHTTTDPTKATTNPKDHDHGSVPRAELQDVAVSGYVVVTVAHSSCLRD